MPVPARPLGSSGLAVSPLSIGSWRTFERIPREAGVAVLRRARELGVTFLDDARYDDETGTAPLRTGYSEVVFGELLAASGWRRDEVVIADKLWWEFWPQESASAELDGSLARLGLDHVDLLYAAAPPPSLAVVQVVEELSQLVASGRTRAWGVLNWPASLLLEAVAVAQQRGLVPPCAAQLPYSLLRHSPVEDDDMMEALSGIEVGAERGWPIGVVASAVLAGGALSGKYASVRGEHIVFADQPPGGVGGRLTGQLDDPAVHHAVQAGARLASWARDLGTSAAAAALAFTLTNPLVSSALFGATSAAQVEENMAALELLERLDHRHVTEMRQLVG